ncbi:hypothetical protein RND81_03G232900 [Saponaria officinalis]|uniref:Exostosin GT47 domain-containing protein n=1 Tax=Saponaria officinalis TaxID=3572 RepID=A0AAW1MBE7_SAPOF
MKTLENQPKLAKMASSSSLSSCMYHPWSLRTLFITISLICTLSLSSLLFFNTPTSSSSSSSSHMSNSQNTLKDLTFSLKVFVFDLPTSFNYGLLQNYPDPNRKTGSNREPISSDHPSLPKNLAIEQHSAEYWLMGDLMTHESLRNGSFAKRVYDVEEADVIFVPFFASVSCEMQLSINKRIIANKVKSNKDYIRQLEVVDLVTNSQAWKRSGGRNFVFVVSDPMAMWHVKREIAPAILLVVDFGAWSGSDSNTPNRVQLTQVSLLKDVIIPYNHLLPVLPLSEDKPRHNLLYFRGGKHRQRGGMIRAKLWDLLANEPGVDMEEGTATASGRKQSVTGMRTSEFCLNPAGDTPTSCRLFDAIQSLCIPVIVSDQIELPYEGMIDYSEFSVFVSAHDALQPKWLVTHLQNISKKQREEYRKNLARVQPMFVYDNGYPGGIGPIHPDGAVNQIWRKVHQKLPMIREAIIRDRRRPPGVSIPRRCHCT